MADTELPPVVDTTAPITDTVTAPIGNEKQDESPLPSATIPSSDNVLNTPRPSDNTTTAPATKPTQTNVYTSSNVDFDSDPSAYVKTKVQSLIYWEYPKKSAIFLAGSLGVLALTQYYSVLQILAGLFSLATGINWVYVNLHKQSQRVISNKQPQEIVNPHNHRLQAKTTYIPRERVLRVAHFTMDVAEVVTQHVTKLVLIEDSMRSFTAFVASFFVWILAKHVSTKNLLSTFILLAFSLPRLYLQHKEVVDAHVAKHSHTARLLAEQYGNLANQKLREVVGQVKSRIRPEKVSVETKKTE
ncbi:hypothetical protein G6F57_004656 [Rhizopus arrhizus]|nr:hypothetical protein G6F30_005925 [Rhizopus arrhizus]KAG1423575.1 hypothetical protein G6F58_002772 [Rhizopus delemar]KAG0983610.1 hypothetical protein G6F29_005407 [Rhizopus arrhizus]KAG0994658.1 hypothetical protein G6F28_005541 [Rhizopus arrhizus]KAG1012896.1 hypothetical protein G6F27_002392 [Rhizopus arrhizus]